MNQPDGKKIFAFLIALYADQEGVKITYELEGKEDVRNLFEVAM